MITVPTAGSSTGFTATQKYYYDPLNRIDDATKTDARTITTTYAYDALNRVKTRAYTDEPRGSETPDVSYFTTILRTLKSN